MSDNTVNIQVNTTHQVFAGLHRYLLICVNMKLSHLRHHSSLILNISKKHGLYDHLLTIMRDHTYPMTSLSLCSLKLLPCQLLWQLVNSPANLIQVLAFKQRSHIFESALTTVRTGLFGAVDKSYKHIYLLSPLKLANMTNLLANS